MSDREQSDTPEQYRLAGEETPTWLALGFTLIGALLAAAAAWLWMTEQPRLQEQRSQDNQIQEQTTVSAVQPDVNLSVKPILLPAETPEVMAAGKEREDCPPAITIPFKRGGARPVITDDIQGHLKRLREWLNGHPEVKLAVHGHADSVGSERHNLMLSYRRAKAVVALLDKAGVPERQMTILSAGESDPIEGIPTDSVDNRRVFLQIKGIENCQDVPTDSKRS